MKATVVIRKILFITGWLAAGAGLMTLLVAANKRERGHNCRSVEIAIRGAGEQFFIDKADIMQQIKQASNGSLVNRPVSELQLSALEETLERGVWIRDAELYVDTRNVLHVRVTEREPIARVFTRLGASFYIDSTGHQLPLLEKETARVLLVTNYPDGKKLKGRDSIMAKGVKEIAAMVNANPVWKEQIAQVDITANGKFEALPMIGNHLIRLGNADKMREKLERLFLFYKQVMRRTGFDKYDIVDVQYRDQVIGVHRGTSAIVDSVQLKKNIEQLLEASRFRMTEDSLAQVAHTQALTDTTGQHLEGPVRDTVANPAAARQIQSDPAQSQPSISHPKPTVRTNKQPKAVMQRRAP